MYQQPSSIARVRAARPAQEPGRPARQTRPERLPGTHLELRMGGPMGIRPLFGDLVYDAKVVGYSPYEYFMVQTMPPLEVLSRLQHSPAMAARANLGGATYTFYTNFLSRVMTPAPVLFLSHPDTVLRELRRHSRRVRVSIPCRVHGAFGDHEGMVVDMDDHGCRFNVRSNLASPLRRAQPGQVVVLNCNLLRPDLPLITPLLLRRVEEAQGRISFGGVFEGLDENGQKQLEEYMRRVHALTEA